MTGTGLLATRYRMGRLLGRGGMGSVHEAHDELLDRAVAVKLLEVAQAPESAVQRFRREAQFLAGLAHPNVVTVFDFGTDDDHAWLVMELLAGPTLHELIDTRGPLPVADASGYARQCAGALAAAHAAGITHRDVKPANVMLAGDGTCKLLDLGIARLNGAVTTQPALTQAGTILGTVPYLAPEVITGAAPEPPSDMYALGGTVFALLTGHPPFRGEDMMAAMAQHVHAPAPRPSAERADVPPAFDELVVALLAKDPDQRPSATDVVARLDGSPAAAVAPTVALGAAAPATTQLITPVAQPMAGASGPPPGRRSRRPLIAAAVLALAAVALVLILVNGGGDTTGHSALPTGSTSSHPSPPRTSASHSPARRTPTAPPRPTTLAGALAALRSATTRAKANGAVSPGDAADLLKRVDAMSSAPSGGGKHGKRKGNEGDASSLSGQLADLANRLDSLRSGGRITAGGYSSIGAALAAMRPFAGAGGGAGGGGGGD
ncbi:MAG: serine/threonine-protein kinase [Jatrophihabitantaceae bacterium]